jgi:hypothetical protein
MFLSLQEQINSDKPELKCIQGLYAGLCCSLKEESTLSEQQVDDLFILIKASLTRIEGISTHGVMKAAMKLLSHNMKVFSSHVTNKALDLVTMSLNLSIHENLDVREAASDMLTALMKEISETLHTDEALHNNNFKNIMDKLQEVLEDPNHANILLIQTIKAVGIFSKAIVTFMGVDQLEAYLARLIELSE